MWKVTESGRAFFFSFLLAAFFFLPVTMPFFFTWLNALVSIPICLLLVVEGRHVGGRQIICSLLLTAGASLAVQRLPLFLLMLSFAPLGFSLAQSIAAQEKAAHSGFKGMLALGLPMLIFWLLYALWTKSNPYAGLLLSLDQSFAQVLALYSKESALPPETLQALNQFIEATRRQLPQLLPSILICLALSTVWLNMVVLNYVIGRIHATGHPWGRCAA